MAKVHVLERTQQGYRCVFHIPVPATNNPVGLPWRTALLRSRGAQTTALPDGDGTGGTISAAEKAQLLAWEILEVIEFVRAEGVPGGQVNAFLDAEFARVQAQQQAKISDELGQFGRVREAP